MWLRRGVVWGAGILVGGFLAEVAATCYRRWTRPAPVNLLIPFNDSSFRCKQDTPCGRRYCCVHNLQLLVDFLDGAHFCLDICIYIFSCDLLAQAVRRAHERGVIVRIVTDNDMAYNNGSRICHFFEQGIKIKSKNSLNLMHHKFCIIDSPSRIAELCSLGSTVRTKKYLLHRVNQKNTGVLVCGSLNWTNQAINGNWEHVLITSHLPIIDLFQCEFDEIWKSFKEFKPY